ncbi:hypothetical protein E2P81_ATG10719 [Venturia nashicola]|nr:hypothetical protein E2P81_ATG10719 [Venturia nashicola]
MDPKNKTTWLRSGTKRKSTDDDPMPIQPHRKMRKLRPKQPSSHYKKLTEEKKSEIRPLRFIGLPSEIRNQVYGYLLVASYIDGEKQEDEEELDYVGYPQGGEEEEEDYIEGREVRKRIFIEKDRFDPRKLGLHTGIFRTNRQIFKEARSYLSAQNDFEINLNGIDETAKSAYTYFSPIHFDLGFIKSIRIQILIDMQHYCRPESHFNWSFLKDMVALETLQIAMVVNQDDWTWKRVAVNGAWRDSLFIITGLVDNINDGLPDHVGLRWDIWDELLKDFSTRERKGQYYVGEQIFVDIFLED